MATITSHVLDAVHGGHAAGIRIRCTRIEADGTRSEVFALRADDEGRISAPVEVAAGEQAQYELEFDAAGYFDARGIAPERRRIMHCVVLRLSLPEPNMRCHVPVIVSPHACSAWWSA